MIKMGKPKQRFTQSHFLEYYDFADEPELVPAIFHSKQGFYERIIKKVKEDVALGVKVDDAIRLNAGVSRQTIWRWKKHFIKELEDGKTDTPLIRLFGDAYRTDAELYRKIMGMAMDKAEEGDAETIRFLAKNRLGYGRPQGTNVNVDNSENNHIQISITDMTGVDNDVIDVEGKEVEGTKEIEE